MKRKLIALYLGSILALNGCTLAGVATGAGASFGVAAAQEGGVSRAVTDARIQAQINDLWFRNDVDAYTKLDMTINQGRVLLTGVVQDPEQRVEAVRLAWQPKGVKQVINEIQVADSGGIVGFARDNWITTRLRTVLTIDSQVQSINYSIDTVQGVVYLMGTAQNQAELNRVVEKARTTPDVKRVVSYVKMVGTAVSDVEQNHSQYQSVDDAKDQYAAPYGAAPDIAPAAGGDAGNVGHAGNAIVSEPLPLR